MIYLLRSFGKDGKSILKVGFSDNLKHRLGGYKYAAPFTEVLETKEGDLIHESLLHLYLKFLGYQFTLEDGSLNEWYIDSSKVMDIFNLSLGELSEKVWEFRDKIFNIESLKITNKRDHTYRLLSFLYEKYEKELYDNPYKIINGIVTRNDSYLELDCVFLDIYNKFNSPDLTKIDISLKEGKIIFDFLNDHFYKTGIFREKMKMYCEFMDQYKDNPEIINKLNNYITNPRFFQFYSYFGTKGCSSRSYQEANLLAELGNDCKEGNLAKEIYRVFKVGDRYPVKDLKVMVGDIYSRLSISRTAKATDLGKYFKLTKTRITLPDKTVVNGFKLESL